MKRLLVPALLLAAVITSFWGGTWNGRHQLVARDGVEPRKVLYFVDPMNPTHTSDRPGVAPCGMKLEPVYSDAVETSAGSARPCPGTVRLSAEKQQVIGVRLATVERKALAHNVRLLGRVAVDETRVYRINATIDGWVTSTTPLAAGDHVRKDETLGGFYSTEFLAAGQALLFALNSADRVRTTGQESEMQRSQMAQFDLNLKQYKDSLKNLGMGDRQVAEMIHTRKFMENVDITSPVDGFILLRNVSNGQRFERGTELYRIADLSRVWILAELFEKEVPFLQPGAKVHLSLPRQQQRFTATVSQALPQFDPTARTLKLRLEADNPELALKPEMFVDLEFPVTLSESVVMPADALLDSGLRKSVFVECGRGVFEPREVQIGQRLGEQVQVLSGLMPGERVVVSGTFLLDSESRMRLAAAGGQRASATDPVCGMAVDEPMARAADRMSELSGRTYFFCSGACKRRFDTEPTRFMPAPGLEASARDRISLTPASAASTVP